MRARKRAKKIDLTVNKLDRETFDLLSAEQISPKELWFITSADSVVVDIDKIGQGGEGYVTSAWVVEYVDSQISAALEAQV